MQTRRADLDVVVYLYTFLNLLVDQFNLPRRHCSSTQALTIWQQLQKMIMPTLSL
jgi:hypothetical protein